MARYFIRGGNYFETVTDVTSWGDGRVAVPQRPDQFHTWDGSAWVDQGTGLQEQRNDASMTRTAFCQMLWRASVLPQSEAVQAARGEWPATFSGFASTLTPDEAADAQIEWAGAMEIRYTAPLLQALALSYAAGDQAAATALLDQIFGVA